MVAQLHHVCQRHKRRRQLMNWISTVEPAPWTIAGFELGPLRFGHCLLMERFDLRGLENKTLLHYFLGICCRDYESARKWLTTENNKPVYEFPSFEENRSECLTYLHENMALPQTLESTGAGKTQGTPFLQSLRLTAISKLGYSPTQINSARFGQLVWDVLSYKEAKGQTRIVDDYLNEQLEKLKEMNAKV